MAAPDNVDIQIVGEDAERRQPARRCTRGRLATALGATAVVAVGLAVALGVVLGRSPAAPATAPRQVPHAAEHKTPGVRETAPATDLDAATGIQYFHHRLERVPAPAAAPAAASRRSLGAGEDPEWMERFFGFTSAASVQARPPGAPAVAKEMRVYMTTNLPVGRIMDVNGEPGQRSVRIDLIDHEKKAIATVVPFGLSFAGKKVQMPTDPAMLYVSCGTQQDYQNAVDWKPSADVAAVRGIVWVAGSAVVGDSQNVSECWRNHVASFTQYGSDAGNTAVQWPGYDSVPYGVAPVVHFIVTAVRTLVEDANSRCAQQGCRRRLSDGWFTWGDDASSSNSDSVCSTIRSYLPSACSMPTCGTSSQISCSVSDDLDGWLDSPLTLSASANLQLCATPASGGIDISGFGTSWSKQFSAEDTVSEPIPDMSITVPVIGTAGLVADLRIDGSLSSLALALGVDLCAGSDCASDYTSYAPYYFLSGTFSVTDLCNSTPNPVNTFNRL